MKKIHHLAIAGAALTTANAATLASGYSTASSQLLTANGGSGQTLFHNSAAVGGNQDVVDSGTAQFHSVLLPGTGLWNLGDTVSITGVALVLRGGNMGSGNFTFNIREAAGGTGASGRGGPGSHRLCHSRIHQHRHG